MLQRDSASNDRGSMLPFFAGLTGLSLLLSIEAAQICASFTYREAMQQTADQLSLIAIAKQITTGSEAASKLLELTDRFSLASFQMTDGQTVEIRLCGLWAEWLKFPGLSPRRDICVNSAAR